MIEVKRLVSFCLVALVLSACGTARASAPKDAVSVDSAQEIRIYRDDERGVTCWVYHLNSGAGIDCLPDGELGQ